MLDSSTSRYRFENNSLDRTLGVTETRPSPSSDCVRWLAVVSSGPLSASAKSEISAISPTPDLLRNALERRTSLSLKGFSALASPTPSAYSGGLGSGSNPTAASCVAYEHLVPHNFLEPPSQLVVAALLFQVVPYRSQWPRRTKALVLVTLARARLRCQPTDFGYTTACRSK